MERPLPDRRARHRARRVVPADLSVRHSTGSMHDTPLISLIAIGLALSLVGGLLAGIAVGPFTSGFVGDATLAPQLAEIGVILPMFGVGMHSPKDLWAVREIALSPGLLPDDAYAPMLAGAPLSIVLNPLVFRIAAPRLSTATS